MTEVSAHKKCCSCDCNEQVPEKHFKLSELFNMHWDEYCKHPTDFIEPEQYKAANAIRTCQTAVLGVDYYSCPECGEITKKYHACKHRFCPSCSWKDTLKWVNAQVQKMMHVKHR